MFSFLFIPFSFLAVRRVISFLAHSCCVFVIKHCVRNVPLCLTFVEIQALVYDILPGGRVVPESEA